MLRSYIQGADQIFYEILDADGLRFHRYPPGTNHDWQTLYQSSDDLERKTSRPDYNRRAKFYDLHASGPQRLTHLLPTQQMRRQSTLTESTEVNDTIYVGFFCRLAKVQRSNP